MKRLLLAFLILAVMVAWGCSNSPEQAASPTAPSISPQGGVGDLLPVRIDPGKPTVGMPWYDRGRDEDPWDDYWCPPPRDCNEGPGDQWWGGQILWPVPVGFSDGNDDGGGNRYML